MKNEKSRFSATIGRQTENFDENQRKSSKIKFPNIVRDDPQSVPELDERQNKFE